ncbi:MAG: hypothetical protein ACRDNW_11450 [Trebonia sp.]
MSRRAPRGGPTPGWPDESDSGNGYIGGGYVAPGRGQPGQPAQNGQYEEYGRYGQYDQYGRPDQYRQYGYNGQYRQGGQYRQRWPPNGQDNQPTQTFNYQRPGTGYPGNGDPRGYRDRPVPGNMRRQADPRQRQADPRQFGGQGYEVPGQGPGDPELPQRPQRDRARRRKLRFRRTRRLFRRRSVRVISAVLAVFLAWAAFSLGEATFKNTGQSQLANAAEWFRDHGFGPVVTFGEWLSYNPPPKGGKPSFSLAVPSGEAVTADKAPKTGGKGKSFVPDVPATLKSLAGTPIAGEGQWRLAEKVNGEPAILTTFLRDATYTSQVNGIASIDQRLVKFSLRPGTEDPGPAKWGVPDYIPAGQRKGLLATFNGGFKLNSAGGGFYLNGIYHGSLVKGAASVVYYKDGTIKIGEWGRDFTMSSSIAGVRQNLKLLVDHGKVSADANSNVMSNWGATLGGGYYVWRSGLGITKDGRIVYVYGSALSAKDLGELLQRAGAVEGMQMDINPAWMKFDYYQAKGNPGDPTPVPLLPTQQPSPYSYYTPSTRDFTAVYAR